MNSRVEDIRKAHAEGNLYFHMLEFGGYNHNFFRVLNGEPVIYNDASKGIEKFSFFNPDFLGATIQPHNTNSFHRQDITGSDLGFHGLSTTAVKSGLPIKLWHDYTNIGLIFDGNSPDYKPFYMCGRDCYSEVRGHQLTIAPAKEPGEGLENIQKPPPQYNFDLTENIEEREKLTREATRVFWQSITPQEGWAHYIGTHDARAKDVANFIPGLNETVAIAHMGSLKGIVVYEEPNRSKWKKNYTDYVHQAAELRERLRQDFPGHFQEALPILSYNPERLQNQLIELTPEMINNPAILRATVSKANREGATR